MSIKTKVIISLLIFLFFSFFSLNLPFEFDKDILVNLRIPRYLGIIITGFSLSTSGLILQLITKNPLADPFIIGTSASAMLGIMLCLIIGISFYDPLYFLIIISFSLVATIFSYKLSYLSSSKSSNNILLSGIAINSFVLSIIVLVVIFSRNWTVNFMHISFGSFSYPDYTKIFISGIIFLVIIIVLYFLNKYIIVFSFDEEKSKTLGIQLYQTKIVIFLIISSLTAISVSLSGIIGFIGLMIPHITRHILYKENFNLIFLMNVIYGGMFLVLSDTISKAFFYPVELPPGVISSIFGSLFFIWLILKEKHR